MDPAIEGAKNNKLATPDGIQNNIKPAKKIIITISTDLFFEVVQGEGSPHNKRLQKSF